LTLFGLLTACGSADREPAPQRLRFWHTFNPVETEALNQLLARGELAPVETTLLPFARGKPILDEVLADREMRDDCPALARIDATWLPDLDRRGLIRPVPDQVWRARDWLPEAAEMADGGSGVPMGLPQSIDGLALIARRGTLARAGLAPPATLNELLADAHRLTRDGVSGLGMRVDGYWFAAFLRASGGELADPAARRLGVDEPIAAEALQHFAELFGPGGVAGPPPPSGSEAEDEVRRFRAGALAIAVDGPWAAPALGGGDTGELEVAPFPPDGQRRPAAPRGGHLLVVPLCARDQEAAWQLALALTDPALQADWARRFGTIPTTATGLAGAGPFAQDFHAALALARPLPRHPLTAELFDDLNPAIAAVVAGDATAQEALAGVARAWTRLFQRHHIAPLPPP
ncbi:MAG TPA: extracellular solute-binding protein, partial [Kofleriaceae bacterium]|nr:extracellular solute-binding protein [Kofleriaceae bacterium]